MKRALIGRRRQPRPFLFFLLFFCNTQPRATNQGWDGRRRNSKSKRKRFALPGENSGTKRPRGISVQWREIGQRHRPPQGSHSAAERRGCPKHWPTRLYFLFHDRERDGTRKCKKGLTTKEGDRRRRLCRCCGTDRFYVTTPSTHSFMFSPLQMLLRPPPRASCAGDGAKSVRAPSPQRDAKWPPLRRRRRDGAATFTRRRPRSRVRWRWTAARD